MKETLEVINRMQEAGIIGKYAIGGAIGATFYLEPTSTFDIDIFISFANAPDKVIVSVEPIYNYLRELGYECEHEHILIEDWQVQFLPADDKLNNEALLNSIETTVDGVKTWVMSAEHLMAIALNTGRGKDFIRLEQFVKNSAYDADKLNEILARNGLTQKWLDFKEKYIEIKK